VLFGSVLALDNATLVLIGAVSSVTLFALAVILRPLALDSYDRSFLRTVSRWSTPVHLLFLTLLVFNLVAGFHAVGTLLAVALVVLPAACARLWRRDLDGMLIVAVLAALLGGVAGLIIAYVWPVPAGPAIVLGLGLFYVVSIVAGPQGALAQRWGRMHVEG
jgi:zinc/manganese transport system permease protein